MNFSERHIIIKEGTIIDENDPSFWLKYKYKSDTGIIHCLDGPAIETNEPGSQQWWVDGIRLNCQSQEEFQRYLKQKAFW